ncbi:hypothetical protein ACLOJK_037513 [Asimina triloba]
MTEVLLSPLLDLIFGNLASSAVQELQLVRGVDEDLQKLKSTLSAIQAVLEDAQEKQFYSNAIQDWLHKPKYVAYDADDLVDEIVKEAQQSKATESGNEAGDKNKKKTQQVLHNITFCFNCIKSPYQRRELATETERQTEREEQIRTEEMI